MKKIIVLISIFFFSITINAQRGKQKIRALKIAYLTNKLDLTATEAEKFWPLYNDYDKKRRELFHFEKTELKNKIKEDYNLDNISDKQAENILTKVYQYRKERHKHTLAFHKTLLGILSAKKILLLEIGEHEFNKKLMRKFRTKNQNRE